MGPRELRRTGKAVVERFQKGELGCLSDTISKLVGLDPESEISAQELAQIILEDYGLVTKVLQTVNSFYYNRLGQEISTVTQAVIMLGFNSVREIALGMAILDLLPEGDNLLAVKLMAEAYLNAHLAQEIGGESVTDNPEEIFLAALFRPFARIVTAMYDPKTYGAVSALEMDSKSQRLAQEFFYYVGRELGEFLKLPASITGHIEGAPYPRSYKGQKVREVLDDVAPLPAALFSEDEAAFIDLSYRIKAVARKYRLKPTALVKWLVASLSKTISYTPRFKEVLDDRSIKRVIREEVLPELKGQVEVEREPLTKGVKDHEEFFLDLMGQLQGFVLGGRFSLDQIYLMATESLHRGLLLDRVLLCMLNPDRTELVARYGLGTAVKGLKDGLRIPFPTKAPPISTAFEEGTETVGTWGQIPTVSMIEPEGNLRKLVCVSPLIVNGRPLGCFLADRFMGSDRFDQKDLKKIMAIRQVVVMATRQAVLRPR